jgi:hypothetical protein
MKCLTFVFVLSCLSACSSAPIPDEASKFGIELRAVAEAGTPLAGVGLAAEGQQLGFTGSDGRLTRDVRGLEGSSLRVSVSCPAEYEQPEQPPPLRLTRTRAVGTQAAQPLTLDVRCQKRLSTIAIVVHAERGERLPILVDGKPIATTDDDGIAHVLLRRPRGDKAVQLGIDTSSRSVLKPVNPTRSYELHGRDAIVLFEPSFVVNKPQGPRIAAPRRHIPVRVD